jgi:hypothetical protein
MYMSGPIHGLLRRDINALSVRTFSLLQIGVQSCRPDINAKTQTMNRSIFDIQ